MLWRSLAKQVRRRRRPLSWALAFCGHGALLWWCGVSVAPQVKPTPITLAIVWQPPPPAPSTPPLEVVKPPPPPLPPLPPPPSESPAWLPPAQAPQETAPTPSPPSETSPSPQSTSPPPSESSSSSSSSSLAPPAQTASLTPSLRSVVVGFDAQGPRPSTAALAAALDYHPDAEQDRALSGGALAAARGERGLKRDLAFDAVTAGLGDDWFREVKRGALRHFSPEPTDLDRPKDVAAPSIWQNYLLDPTSWDDVAKELLTPMYEAQMLASTDPVQRLALGNSAALGEAPTSPKRQAMVNDLLRRKKAGLSVRFAFEVDVHHDGAGRVTAIDVLHGDGEPALRERVRAAVEAGVADAGAAAARIASGKPFRSRWLFVATWYIDPPPAYLASSSSLFAQGSNTPTLMFGGTFDVGADGGITTSGYDVKMKTAAELLSVEPL